MADRSIKELFKGSPLAIRYFFYSLAILLASFFVVDTFVIPSLEDSGKVVSVAWKAENVKLQRFMSARNKADDACPVWRSELFPVSLKKTKAKRILVMGDSYVWGDGYANLNTIWWRQLQLELERRGYNDVEVIAAGMRGAPTWKEVKWAEKLVPEYKPDVLIWGYLTNDPDEGEEIERAGGKAVKALILPPDTAFPDRVTKVMEGLYPNLSDQLFDLRKKHRETEFAGERFGYRFGDWEERILKGENFEYYKRTAKKLADYSKGLSIPSFVIDFPNAVTYAGGAAMAEPKDRAAFFANVRAYYLARFTPVHNAFAAFGMPFDDILDDFLAYAQAQSSNSATPSQLSFGINPCNSHPGPLATRFYAIKAADYIEAHYPDALGPKTQPKPLAVATINDTVPADMQLKQNEKHAYFVYPESEANLLSMPIRKPFVMINLDRPRPLSEIKLIGEQLKDADIQLILQDPSAHYDKSVPIDVGAKSGGALTWKLEKATACAPISSILIHAHYKGTGRGTIMDLTPVAGVLQ